MTHLKRHLKTCLISTDIIFVIIFMIIGILISNKVYSYLDDKNAEYLKATHITEKELFQYAIDTELGNIFVYGKLKAIDTVTDPNIKGEYMCIKKVKEKYTRHTRTVTKKSGKTTIVTEEEYYTWDKVDTTKEHSKEISFLDIKFPYKKILPPLTVYLKTVKTDSKTRYKYYVCNKEYTGTLYTTTKNKTIKDKSRFYKNSTIEKTLKRLTTGDFLILCLFWFCWLCMIVLILVIKTHNRIAKG